MYQLISAIAKNMEDDTRWHNVDIGTMPMRELYATYSRVIVTLSNNFLPYNVSLDLADIRATVGALSSVFPDVLIANGNATLPTSKELPIINTRFAKYADASRAGYSIIPTAPGVSPEAQLPPSEKTWLYLKKADITSYEKMRKSVLAVVNGFIHATDADVKGFYIQEGMKSQMISGTNLLGLISFEDIGELTFIPIKPAMLYKQNDRQLYRNQCFIDSGRDLSQKTVMLVLGGYLHVLDEETMYRVSDSSFCINFNKIPLMDRYYDSKKYIDLDSLNVEVSSANEEQISVKHLYSDEAIAAYCTLSQSFFVVLDNKDIFVDRIPVEDNIGPGMYTTMEPPKWPLVGPYGRLLNYWYKSNGERYALTAHDTLIHRRLYDTVNAKVQNSVSSSDVAVRPNRNSRALFLRIGTDI